ncbi:MAG: ATP-binding protein [Candidatus Brocadiales bacterium]|nr:ATP-binding protein [Candidatus Brocadiales bacterium]
MVSETNHQPKLERNSTHLAGEYFVAAELYRRGFSVGMTIGNAKAIDILAYKDKNPIAIQVKAIKNKKSVGWPIMRDKVEDGIIYIFVNLNNQDHPDYFICNSLEAREKVKQYKTRGIIDLTTLRNTNFHDRWDKLE